ncbi:hypothetical protein QE390_000061 [Siphonobacter sp. SORGH_AS 1065]|nr:hypothetical protein [Siphonobacter sp. SORGH_AS_1065]
MNDSVLLPTTFAVNKLQWSKSTRSRSALPSDHLVPGLWPVGFEPVDDQRVPSPNKIFLLTSARGLLPLTLNQQPLTKKASRMNLHAGCLEKVTS